MKRFVIAVLTLAIVVAIAPLPSAAASSSHAVSAKVFASARSGDHVDKDGQVALSFTNGGVRVTGSLGGNAFDVSGKLTKSALSDQRLVAHAQDALGVCPTNH